MNLKKTLAIAGLVLAVLTGCGRKPLTPVAPWTDIADDSLCFLATTTDPDGLGLEYTFDWGDGQTFETRRYQSGETAYARHAFAGNVWHDVKVQARNENGKSSDWSAPLRFRKSQPPVISDDTISGPVRWAVNRWYRASVQVPDPDGDSVSVKFIWDGDEGGTWTEFVPSGNTFTDSNLWTAPGTHTLKVVARDQGGMSTRPDCVKTVCVGEIAILWMTADSDDLGSTASLTMGEIAGEPVLYVNADPRVVCLRLDGSLVWATDIGDASDFGPSLSSDGARLYLAIDRKGLYCLDARAGTILWRMAIPFGSLCGTGTPAVGPDGAIYIQTAEPSADTAFVTRISDCVDSAHIDWSVPFPAVPAEPGCGVAVGGNGVAYAACWKADFTRGILVAIDSTGTVMWQDTTHLGDGGYALYAPVIDSRDRVVIGDAYGNLHCFEPNGALAWSVYADPWIYHGGIAVGYDDRIYFQTDDASLCCYDSDGNQLWAAGIPHGAPGRTTPCILSDSTILTYGGEFNVLSCFSRDGEALWSFSIDDSVSANDPGRRRDEGDDEGTPIVGRDGRVYLSNGCSVFCLAIGETRLANTAWPTYNHDNAHSGWAGRP